MGNPGSIAGSRVSGTDRSECVRFDAGIHAVQLYDTRAVVEPARWLWRTIFPGTLSLRWRRLLYRRCAASAYRNAAIPDIAREWLFGVRHRGNSSAPADALA